MKVIDLLVKIANGEEVPHFECGNIETYLGADGYLKDQYGDDVEWMIDKNWLNHEVQIIQEPKKIEKLHIEYEPSFKEHCEKISSIPDEISVVLKLNEIIDYINGDNNENS